MDLSFCSLLSFYYNHLLVYFYFSLNIVLHSINQKTSHLSVTHTHTRMPDVQWPVRGCTYRTGDLDSWDCSSTSTDHNSAQGTTQELQLRLILTYFVSSRLANSQEEAKVSEMVEKVATNIQGTFIPHRVDCRPELPDTYCSSSSCVFHLWYRWMVRVLKPVMSRAGTGLIIKPNRGRASNPLFSNF